MKQNENNNRDATLKGDEIRSGFTTINNLRIRARLARNGTSGDVTGNSDNSFTPLEAVGGTQIPPQLAELVVSTCPDPPLFWAQLLKISAAARRIL